MFILIGELINDTVLNMVSKKKLKQAKEYEKKVAKRHGKKHHGGPGKPDFGKAGEVKDHKKRLSKSLLQNECQKGRKTIVSKKGFTQDAIDYRNRYRRDVKLYHDKNIN